MACLLCGEKENLKEVAGYEVCPACCEKGLEDMLAVCLQSRSSDPVKLLEELMALPRIPMHGPIHHVLVGAALLTAYANAGGKVDLPQALAEISRRGQQVPGAVCGYWGACGAGISTGMYVSIVTQSGPLAREVWRLPNQMTARALTAISSHGGPRCCKRDACLAIQEAVDFTARHLGVRMEASPVVCSRSHLNAQCLGEACPFHPKK